MSWLIDALRAPVVELAQLLVTAGAAALAVRLRGKQVRLDRRVAEVERPARKPRAPRAKPSSSSSSTSVLTTLPDPSSPPVA